MTVEIHIQRRRVWESDIWGSEHLRTKARIGVGVDVGSRHMGLFVCVFDRNAPLLQGQWPGFRELYKANVDLESTTCEETVRNFANWHTGDEAFSTWLKQIAVVAIERQIGGTPSLPGDPNPSAANPRMVAISHALQMFFLLKCPKECVLRLVNHSQTEPLFEKQFSLTFPNPTKRRNKPLKLSAHQQYTNRKANSVWLAQRFYANHPWGQHHILPMPEGVRHVDIYESMLILMTYMMRYEATKVRKKRKTRSTGGPKKKRKTSPFDHDGFEPIDF